jgi:phenylalanyl-tRNA synthetase beta chain
MPVINFKYSDLCSMLGQEVPQQTLVDRIPMIGADMHETEGECDDMSVEFFPDRPDLYSVEGLARAMRAFLDIQPGMKTYDVGEYDADVYVDESVRSVRPYFRCGVVLGVDIDDTMLKSIMEMQEKLHITIGRKRSKLAIGIHDLDKVTPPFTFKTADPHSIRFVPLAKTEEMDMAEILEKHEKGRDYAHLLDGFDRYPVILDTNGQVLSFPPIINGALTTVTTSTRNLFIDVTGNDLKAVKGALDIVATSLAERGGKIMTVRMHESGRDFLSPDLTPGEITISASECDKFLGVDLGPEGTVECLRRMGMDAVADGDAVHVKYPSVRLDIMHKVDIFEDVGTGYGFDRFGGKYTLQQTPGSLDQINTFSESIRDLMVGLGFMEVTTLTLSNDKDQFELSGLPRMDNVRVLNPITEDHTCLRTYLMPSLVQILKHNKHRSLPQRIFEVGYVVRDAKVVPHLCAMETAWKTSFTDIKSIAESILREMGCEFTLEPCELPTFVGGRGAYIVTGGKRIGMFGEMAPEVVVGYEITHPIVFVEIDLASILAERKETLF